MTQSWARHYQNEWESKAADDRLPDWLRVAALAYGRHRANGHAMFGRGDVALVLARVDRESGEVRPLQRANLRRAIQTAITYGWLGAESTSMCLVVPGHAITGGMGNPLDDCPQHLKRRSREQQRQPLRAVS